MLSSDKTSFSAFLSRLIILSIQECPLGRQGSPQWPLSRLSPRLRLRLSMAPQVDLLIHNITLIQVSTGTSGMNSCGRGPTYSCSLCLQLWRLRTRFQAQDRRSRTPSNLISARLRQIKPKTLILYLHSTRFSKRSGFRPPLHIFLSSLPARIPALFLNIDSFTGIHSHWCSMASHAPPVLRCS